MRVQNVRERVLLSVNSKSKIKRSVKAIALELWLAEGGETSRKERTFYWLQSANSRAPLSFYNEQIAAVEHVWRAHAVATCFDLVAVNFARCQLSVRRALKYKAEMQSNDRVFLRVWRQHTTRFLQQITALCLLAIFGSRPSTCISF